MATGSYGTTGKILRVDLTKGTILPEELSEQILHDYLGGTALGVKYLYDEVDPSLDWNHPENRIYFGSGPLGGTRLAGSACYSIVTKGVLTGGPASTQGNGFFGAFLKFSGFDGILLHGAASQWQYLYVHDGVAELRDAQHLLGKDTWELEAAIKEELGYSPGRMSVIGIGPAGENLVKFAGIHGDKGHSAAHNGVGAVLGSKRLKAIAVSRSSGKVPVADEVALSAAAKEIVEAFQKTGGGEVYNWGTSRAFAGAIKSGILPVRNYTTNLFPEADTFVNVRERFEMTKAPCWACPSSHHMHIKVTEGPYTGYEGKEPEYEQYAAFGPQIGNTDPGGAVVLSNEGDRLGMDCNEMGWMIGWVMECYEAGILSSKDLDGLEMTWGNVEASRELMRNIANRRGFGDRLAEGLRHAALSMGPEAAKRAIFTQAGNIPRGHDHRSKWWEFMDTVVTESGTLQNQLLFLDLVPYGLPAVMEQHSWEQVATAEGKTTGTLTFVDSLVVCWFVCCGRISLLCKALNAATGWSYTFEDAMAVGRRAVNLMKMYNVRRGIGIEAYMPSARYGSSPVDGPGKDLDIMAHWKEMLATYHELMGWDIETGVPKPETLRQLGLDYVIGDIP